MTVEIILQILLFGVALSMDAFASSVTLSLTNKGLNLKRSLFTAGVFGFMQGAMPLLGYFVIELISHFVGESGGAETGRIMSLVITWTAFGLLMIVGWKMVIEGIAERLGKKEIEQNEFSYKQVLLLGVVTSIDALAVGVSLHAGLSSNQTIWLHIVLIAVITFGLSLLGLLLGSFFVKLFRGKLEIATIVGGLILVALGVWVVLSHYLGI